MKLSEAEIKEIINELVQHVEKLDVELDAKAIKDIRERLKKQFSRNGSDVFDFYEDFRINKTSISIEIYNYGGRLCGYVGYYVPEKSGGKKITPPAILKTAMANLNKKKSDDKKNAEKAISGIKKKLSKDELDTLKKHFTGKNR